jgi:hypothetical protein
LEAQALPEVRDAKRDAKKDAKRDVKKDVERDAKPDPKMVKSGNIEFCTPSKKILDWIGNDHARKTCVCIKIVFQDGLMNPIIGQKVMNFTIHEFDMEVKKKENLYYVKYYLGLYIPTIHFEDKELDTQERKVPKKIQKWSTGVGRSIKVMTRYEFINGRKDPNMDVTLPNNMNIPLFGTYWKVHFHQTKRIPFDPNDGLPPRIKYITWYGMTKTFGTQIQSWQQIFEGKILAFLMSYTEFIPWFLRKFCKQLKPRFKWLPCDAKVPKVVGILGSIIHAIHYGFWRTLINDIVTQETGKLRQSLKEQFLQTLVDYEYDLVFRTDINYHRFQQIGLKYTQGHKYMVITNRIRQTDVHEDDWKHAPRYVALMRRYINPEFPNDRTKDIILWFGAETEEGNRNVKYAQEIFRLRDEGKFPNLDPRGFFQHQGTVKKPLDVKWLMRHVGPNRLAQQFSEEYREVYPNMKQTQFARSDFGQGKSINPFWKGDKATDLSNTNLVDLDRAFPRKKKTDFNVEVENDFKVTDEDPDADPDADPNEDGENKYACFEITSHSR